MAWKKAFTKNGKTYPNGYWRVKLVPDNDKQYGVIIISGYFDEDHANREFGNNPEIRRVYNITKEQYKTYFKPDVITADDNQYKQAYDCILTFKEVLKDGYTYDKEKDKYYDPKENEVSESDAKESWFANAENV